MLADLNKAKLQAKHLGMTLKDFLARKELLLKQAEVVRNGKLKERRKK